MKSGIINVLKPTEMTSHDVVAIIRKKMDIKKVGHTGTLDPMAAGVLPVCIGSATKLSQYMTQKHKTYVCIMEFGYQTTTLDLEGEISVESELKPLSIDQINECFLQLEQITEQIPPMFSAIKKKGKKLYQYALRGQTIELEPRKIKIHSIRLLDYQYPQVRFEVSCSAGTYIRSLVRDIGHYFKQSATMTGLVRTRSGSFCLEDAKPLDKIHDHQLEKLLIPISDIDIGIPQIELDKNLEFAFNNGQMIPLDALTFPPVKGKFYAVYNEKKRLLGIGKEREKNNEIVFQCHKRIQETRSDS